MNTPAPSGATSASGRSLATAAAAVASPRAATLIASTSTCPAGGSPSTTANRRSNALDAWGTRAAVATIRQPPSGVASSPPASCTGSPARNEDSPPRAAGGPPGQPGKERGHPAERVVELRAIELVDDHPAPPLGGLDEHIVAGPAAAPPPQGGAVRAARLGRRTGDRERERGLAGARGAGEQEMLAGAEPCGDVRVDGVREA